MRDYFTKEEYAKLLQDPRWKKLSAKIKKRDGYRCCKCGSKENLNVHHIGYRGRVVPWEYNELELVTLCKACHEKEHEVKDGVATKINIIKDNYSSDRCIISFDQLEALFNSEYQFALVILIKLFSMVEYNKNCTKLSDSDYHKIMKSVGGKMKRSKDGVALLKKLGFLRNKDGYWYINPKIFWKGDSYEQEKFIEKYYKM